MDEIYQKLTEYFIAADVAGAMEYMKRFPEMDAITEAYVDLFEREHYLRYDVPEELNDVLLCYQQYFRDAFYLHKDTAEAELLAKLPSEEELTRIFRAHGWNFVGGKTNGFYGPYVWKTTVPTEYEVRLPEGVSRYRVNMLRDIVMRSWMDYVTFGLKGTGGWVSPGGTINCVENAYDLNGEEFQVSLLKHEAQHAEDLKRWKGIEAWELEYRAKLVELMYTKEIDLLANFRAEADESKTGDSHALASARLMREMGELIFADIPSVQRRARELFSASTREMDEKYKK